METVKSVLQVIGGLAVFGLLVLVLGLAWVQHKVERQRLLLRRRRSKRGCEPTQFHPKKTK